MILIDGFQGTIPRVEPANIGGNHAQTAENCKLWATTLAPFRGTTAVNTPTKSGTILTIFRWAGTMGNLSSGYWFHWLQDVDVARDPRSGNTTDRVLYTGESEPRQTDNSIATSGGTDYPEGYRTLGVPAPANALTATPDDVVTCDPAEESTVTYVYTFVTAWGEEGPPSPASAALSRCQSENVDISGMDTSTAVSGTFDITHKRIYRSVTSASGTQYQYVKQVALATATATDALTDAQLGEVIPSVDWDMPPATMKAITALPNGIILGVVENTIHVSEQFYPHAWPIAYQLSTDWRIVGLAAFGISALVATEGQPYIISGVTPSAMSLQKLELDQSCVSKRSIASMGEFGAVYASPDGLVLVGPSGARLITEGLYTQDEWRALNPYSMIGAGHDGRYVCFYDTGAVQGGIIIDPRHPENGVVEIDMAPTAIYQDLLSDGLYLMLGDDIVRWDDSGAAALTYTWRSKKFQQASLKNFGWAKVIANSYSDLTFKLYCDGTLKHTKTVTSRAPFRLPSGFLCEDVEIQLEGTDEVRQVAVAQTTAELVAL